MSEEKRQGPGSPSDAPAWVPPEHVRSRSRLLSAAASWGFGDVASLHRASVDDPEWFWRAVVDDLDIDFSAPFQHVRDDSDGKPFPRWFVGGEMNVARLCSHRHALGDRADKAAVIYEGDDGQRREMTFCELDREVRRFAANLVQRGIGRGDRVVLFLPVVPEAAVAFLACAMIGAISVPAFTGYGAEALAMRLRESEAKAIVTVDGTTRRGRRVEMKATADEAVASVDGVEAVFIVRHLGDAKVALADGEVYWDELESDPPPVETVELPADAPLTIIYTSGTTGAPKGIVLSHAGFAVKAAVDFAYAFDIHEDDVVAWIADMGWMLGPLLLVGGLQIGATLVLTEGVPTHPTPSRLFDIIERNGVTFQGIAPTAARAILSSGQQDFGDLSSLRTFASTGEAWDGPTWKWLFETVGQSRRPIINYSGGTETGGGILVSYPFLPSHVAAFNGPLPGMDVAVADDTGSPVVGSVGELTVRNTWPGMTHAFWQDRDRYLDTYWNRWSDVWVHGDLASVDESGVWRIHGRSDDTIKVSGRRVGPAELEASLLKDPRISEAAVVGVPDEQRGQRIAAFVVLRDGQDLDDEITAEAIRNVGRSFAPTLFATRTLPKTKNGKIMRRAIRSMHLGEPLGDMSSLDPATPLEDIPTHDETGVLS